MSRRPWLVSLLLLILPPTANAQVERERLIDLKALAIAANYRNDQDGLRAAIAGFDRARGDSAHGRRALYYAGWSRWMLAASLLQTNDSAAALESLESAVENLSAASERNPADPEVLAVHAWALSAIAVIKPARRPVLGPIISALRRESLALGPDNPRVILMDAGLTFFTPAQFGGSQERGLERWLFALEKFRAEIVEDSLEPDWGLALAYGWLANLYLAVSPAKFAEARAAANRALQMQPDFWWVTTQVLPRIPDPNH